jgi:hypothetical protein
VEPNELDVAGDPGIEAYVVMARELQFQGPL